MQTHSSLILTVSGDDATQRRLLPTCMNPLLIYQAKKRTHGRKRQRTGSVNWIFIKNACNTYCSQAAPNEISSSKAAAGNLSGYYFLYKKSAYLIYYTTPSMNGMNHICSSVGMVLFELLSPKFCCGLNFNGSGRRIRRDPWIRITASLHQLAISCISSIVCLNCLYFFYELCIWKPECFLAQHVINARPIFVTNRDAAPRIVKSKL